jgi:hypothetical protein
LQKDVHVVFGTTDQVNRNTVILRDETKIPIQFIAKACLDEGPMIFRGEDQMEVIP